MALIPPFFMNSVVAIGSKGEGGRVNWVASGFFYGKLDEPVKADTAPEQRQYRAYLVTNKHVVKDYKEIVVRVNPKAAEPARNFDARLVDPATGGQLWAGHDIAEVDVAVVPINYKLLLDQQMEVGMFTSDGNALDVAGMSESEVSEGDRVFALGFPMGLVGEARNTVIVRGGVVSRIRDTLATPTAPFMVDTVVFPGNSGGPVVSQPEMISIQGTKSHPSAHLIGIIAGYVPFIDVAVSQQTKRPRVTFEENSGLTLAYSVDCINDTINKHQATSSGKAQHQAQPRPVEIPDDDEDGTND